jgi:short-subunit dehydrogenase
MELADRTVLLTGATGGLGHALARGLHARGARLVLSGRRIELLKPLAAELGGRAVACDLADRGDVERLAADCASVDVLVANAGVPASGPLEAFSPAQIDRALEVNLRAPMVLTRLLLEGWRARGSGHLVVVSSMSGKVGTTGSTVYAATKFGLRGFAQGLRDELHGSGIGVSAVFPGFIRDAGMFVDSGVRLPRGVGTRAPDEVAGAVVRAIEEDCGELDVAPALLRVGAKLSGVAPELVAGVSRRLGSGAVAEDFARGQAAKR